MALTGYVGKLLAQGVMGEGEDIECFKAIPHQAFPGGKWLRTPALVAAMGYFKLKDYL